MQGDGSGRVLTLSHLEADILPAGDSLGTAYDGLLVSESADGRVFAAEVTRVPAFTEQGAAPFVAAQRRALLTCNIVKTQNRDGQKAEGGSEKVTKYHKGGGSDISRVFICSLNARFKTAILDNIHLLKSLANP